MESIVSTPTVLFPLYDTLNAKVSNKDLSQGIDKTKFLKGIQTLDQDGLNKMYALIRYHEQLQTNPQIKTIRIPFNGKYIDGELTFDLDDIPNQLQHILFEFIILHLEHMKRMKKMEKEKKSIQKKTIE